jgi:hypothetical protein
MPRAETSVEPAALLATPLAASIHQRNMATPVLLFAAAHRPLAFAAGNLLAVAAPLAAVLGMPHVQQWAELLTAPEGIARLQAELEAGAAPAAGEDARR